MAISKVKLPDNSSQELHDYRISGVDSSPSSGSGNVVTSGGVYTALAGKVSSSSVSTIVSLTQAQYNALTTKDANTAYIITDAQSGGTTEVFWATYGTTTFADVLAAYNAGKLVCVNHNGTVLVLSSYNSTDSEFLFASCDEEFHIEFLYLHSEDDEWEGVGTPLAGTVSPTFTGTPTAPTAATGTNTTQIATTAFVQNTINSSSNKEVFVAIQGTTSYDDIETAVENGKIVFAVYHDDYYLPLVDFGQSAEFAAVVWYGSGWTLMYTSVDDEDWYNVSTFPIELSLNKVTSLSSSSTDTQYPSAKATYDAIQNAAPVFWATYGTTTNTEIRAAVNAGKHVLLKYASYIYELQNDDGDIYFYCHDLEGNRKIVLEDDGETGTWNTPVVTVFAESSSLSGKENTSNKVTSLSSSSTDTQYPSAKCVYDLLGDVESLINAL